MNSKVWVLKEQPVRGAVSTQVMDYSPAMEFGELVFVTEFDPPIHPNGQSLEHWNNDVHKFIQEFNPEKDYIVATGRPDSIFSIGFKLGWLMGRTRTSAIRFLVWRREENRYRVRVFDQRPVAAAV